MKHWSVETDELKKDKNAYAIWKLEQMINFGLGNEKIKKQELLTYWDRLDLDSSKKKFLSLILEK